MAEQKKCPLCGKESKRHSCFGPLNQLCLIDCDICGEYEITDQALHYLELGCREKDLYLLSGVTRITRWKWGRCYRIKKDVVCEDQAFEIEIRSMAPLDVNDRMNMLLQYLVNESENYGAIVKLDPKLDYPIVFGKNNDEFLFCLKHLVEMNYLDDSNSTMNAYELVITAKGWERVEQLQKPNIESKQAFVAMWFSDEVEGAFTKGIAPLEGDTGFSMLRVDTKQFNEKICDRIIAEIRESRFLVADVTGQRQGVYFEAGYAKGLGLPVIWTCREDEKEKCHFDTRQYNHIFWKTPEELRDKLRDRILATIGRV